MDGRGGGYAGREGCTTAGRRSSFSERGGGLVLSRKNIKNSTARNEEGKKE